MKEHEKKGEEYRANRDNKKQKVYKTEEDEKYADAFTGYNIPLDTLPALCIERIFAMVSYVFVCVCGWFSWVTIDTYAYQGD